ncbi:MAG: glycosyltransferase [Lachnospiraceae bacterium]|nr:glycosyltransferase [Lachnospiraceae bacterium]
MTDNKICITIEQKIKKAKKKIDTCIEKEKYEDALELIQAFSWILYEYNQYYYDEHFEKCIQIISDKVLNSENDYVSSKNTILFFDAFGLNSRGLAQIYIKALCKRYNVVYVTYDRQKNNIPDILRILRENNGSAYYLTQSNCLKMIERLNVIVEKVRPEIMFMYDVPDDVVGTVVFNHYKGKTKRFQINLTDHAFWLGTTAFDYCLEFRNYGASISNYYRNISLEKLLILPYYPIINSDIEFEGYPFQFDDKENLLVFSGGALYKTLGAENRYYKIVDYILSSYPEIVFWYAGSGDCTEMNKLKNKYSNRIFITEEREDLNEILKRCTFYLSTYPVCGGLMFQYAAMAGKVPVTLKFDNISDDILINQGELNVEFLCFEEMKREIKRLIKDKEYRIAREEKMKKAVISEVEFENELFSALDNGKTSYPVVIKEIDIASTKAEYISRFKFKNLYCGLARKDAIQVCKYFPIEFMFGVLLKISYKMMRFN